MPVPLFGQYTSYQRSTTNKQYVMNKRGFFVFHGKAKKPMLELFSNQQKEWS